jgi:hypothetical protein
MPKLTIEPDAMETLAEDIEDEAEAEELREKAAGGETMEVEISERKRDRLVTWTMLQQFKEQLDGIEDDYERGKLEGKIETVEMILNKTERVVWKDEDD